MADAIGHGVITVLLQALPGPPHHGRQALAMEQALCQRPAQLPRPIPQQGPGSRRSIEKTAVRGMPGNQVGGVFDNQSIQPPCLGRFALGDNLRAGFPATGQHAIFARARNEGPHQNAVGELRLDAFDRPLLRKAGLDQRQAIDRQQASTIDQGQLLKQHPQCGVEFQRLRLSVQQETRLRIMRKQG